MKIPISKLIRIEDFPDDVKDWIGSLLSTLNTFVTTVVTALTGQLTFGENIKGQEFVSSFTYTGSELPIAIRNTMGVQARCLYVAMATENERPVALVPAWQVTDSGSVSVTGLYRIDAAGAGPLTMMARYRVVFRFTP